MARSRKFGQHIKSLRKARGYTQEQLAGYSGLSSDTIRRLEHGSFSPSLDTLAKLAGGMELRLTTLFESHELGEREPSRELLDLVAGRPPRDAELALSVIRALFARLDARDAEDGEADDD